MKFLKPTLAAVFASLMLFSLTGCLSNSNPTVEPTKVTTVNMYVNIPTTPEGIATLALVKVTNGSFSDPTSFSFTGTPTLNAAQPVLTYYAYCEGVAKTLEQISTKKVTLSFNSKQNGSGYKLDFSDTNAILRSLLIMAAYEITDVYAIYKY